VSEELEWWINTPGARLIIEMPPRHGKTELVSIRLPAFIFGQDPDARIIAVSYNDNLVRHNSREIQSVIASPSYGALFPEVKLASMARGRGGSQTQTQNEFEIVDHRGMYLCAPIGGGITGFGADYFIIDDPIKTRKEAESETVQKSLWDWYKSTARTRLEPGGRILLTLTRWHVNDLAAKLLEKAEETGDSAEWRRVHLPALSEPRPDKQYSQTERDEIDRLRHPKDPRKGGKALWPPRYSEEDLEATEQDIGDYDFGSMYQGRPQKPGGKRIKREWFKIIDASEVPPDLICCRYWDLAVTKKTSADRSAGAKGGLSYAADALYIFGIVMLQDEWPEVEKVIEQTAQIDGTGVPVGVEATGTQSGFVQSLQNTLYTFSVDGYNVHADKLLRALPWISWARRGKVYLVRGPWVTDFLEEAAKFTGLNDAHDDQIDAVSGLFVMLTSTIGDFVEG
jgi:predicted phage terminase large subunit-like protein